MLYLIVKIKFLQICIIQIQTLMILCHMVVLIQNPARKTYVDLAEWMVITSTSIVLFQKLFSKKPWQKPKDNFNSKASVTTFHKDTYNDISLKNI